MQEYRHLPLTPGQGDKALEEVLRQIAVPRDVLSEAKKRRNLVCDLALRHPAARGKWYSGSIAHGTHNSPLGDADCGVMVDRTSMEFRAFGPDAEDGGRGPEDFIQSFSAFILPLIRQGGYPNAEVDLTGNRSIKFVFNERVDIGDFGIVDPYVDLIVGLDRRNQPGIWIPNRRKHGWDAAHPQKHTELMTTSGGQELVVHRAHLIRLGKRAIKRDGQEPRVPVLCSWNFSALALEHVTERAPLASSMATLFDDAAASIAAEPTADPAGVADPIALPDGMTRTEASRRLSQMGQVMWDVAHATTQVDARRALSRLFGVEIDEIRAREYEAVRRHPLNPALQARDAAAIGAAAGLAKTPKVTRSHGASWK